MFQTLIILCALNFWEIECTPNRGRSFPPWLAFMTWPGISTLRFPSLSIRTSVATDFLLGTLMVRYLFIDPTKGG